MPTGLYRHSSGLSAGGLVRKCIEDNIGARKEIPYRELKVLYEAQNHPTPFHTAKIHAIKNGVVRIRGKPRGDQWFSLGDGKPAKARRRTRATATLARRTSDAVISDHHDQQIPPPIPPRPEPDPIAELVFAAMAVGKLEAEVRSMTSPEGQLTKQLMARLKGFNGR